MLRFALHAWVFGLSKKAQERRIMRRAFNTMRLGQVGVFFYEWMDWLSIWRVQKHAATVIQRNYRSWRAVDMFKLWRERCVTRCGCVSGS